MDRFNDSNWTGRTPRTLAETRLGAHASLHESRPQSRVLIVVSILGAIIGAVAIVGVVCAAFGV